MVLIIDLIVHLENDRIYLLIMTTITFLLHPVLLAKERQQRALFEKLLIHQTSDEQVAQMVQAALHNETVRSQLQERVASCSFALLYDA